MLASWWRLAQGRLKQFSSVLGANVFNNAVSFVITIMSARLYSTAEFGGFAVATSIVSLLSLVLDLGCSVTLVRLYSRTENQAERDRWVRVVIRWKLVVVVLLAVIGWPVTGWLIRLLPTLLGSMGLVYVSIVSGGLLSVWGTIRAVEQARHDFRSFSSYTVAYGSFRILILPLLILGVKLPLVTVLVGMYTGPLIALLAHWLYRHWRILWVAESLRLQVVAIKQMMSYAVWVTISVISYNFLVQLPQFSLARQVLGSDAAVYGVATTFMAGFSLINDAIRTVVLPEVASMKTWEARERFKRRMFGLTPVYVVLMMVALCGIVFIQQVILGEKYAAATPVSMILGFATVINMFFGILNTLVHSFGIPRTDALINVGRLLGLCILLWLIPASTIPVSIAYALILVLGELVLFLSVRKHARSVRPSAIETLQNS